MPLKNNQEKALVQLFVVSASVLPAVTGINVPANANPS